MATLGRITIDGHEMAMIQYKLRLHQDVDNHSRICSEVRGGMIHVVVESSPDNGHIYAWAADKNMVKDGEIIFKRNQAANAMRKVTFKNAYCVRYDEDYDALDETLMTITFSIAAGEITSDTTTFKNLWG